MCDFQASDAFVNDIFTLMGRHAASIVIYLPTFRITYLSNPQWQNRTGWPLKMGRIGIPETSITTNELRLISSKREIFFISLAQE